MSSSKSSDLFLLIKSMTKSEKRAFKIFAKRGGGTQYLFLKLFDLVDNYGKVEDDFIFKKMKLESRSQFSNLKRHLYSQVLNSLLMLNVDKQPNIKIRKYIDLAYVLYGKGLYMQALNILNTAKQHSKKYGTDLSLLTILEIEKNIHSRHITRINKNTIDDLLSEAKHISESLADRVHLTNLKMNLHRMYIQEGHVKSEVDFNKVTRYFESQITNFQFNQLGIMEKIYYCQCYVWYNYVIDDYKACLKYAKKWVKLFKTDKDLQKRDFNLFLRGYHYVLTSAFNIKNYNEHDTHLEELEFFRKNNYKKFNQSHKVFSFQYVHTARFNNVFLAEDFLAGLKLIPRTLRRIKRYNIHLDQHKIMVLHYKIAWTYIGAKKPKNAIPFLEGIIALRRKSLREDIQSYARLMHLMALYNLEDYNEILRVLRKYKYYFEQVSEINTLQKEAFKYFYKICNTPIFQRKKIHADFLLELNKLKKNKFEKRAFLYLDIIYWIKNTV